MKIRIGHTHDADDAYMFYGMREGGVDCRGLDFEHELQPLSELNRLALEGELEMTAVSFHAYSRIWRNYAPLPMGVSLGHGYGPRILTRPGVVITGPVAVPGLWSTACLLLRLWNPELTLEETPFHEIEGRVQRGEVSAGVVIHEVQLHYADLGLELRLDLGQWWHEQTGLPIPLGVNVVRRDLGPEVARTIAAVFRDSIQCALDHPDAALDYAIQFGRGIGRDQARQFVGMYVNESTLDLGAPGRDAVRELYRRAVAAGILSEEVLCDFVEPAP